MRPPAHNFGTPETRRKVWESYDRLTSHYRRAPENAARFDKRRRMYGTRIVVVTGGRDYGDKYHVCATLDQMHRADPFRLLIEGGADGADTIARKWADWRGVPHLTVPALWDKHGKAAGPLRNRQMLHAKPDVVVAFPGGDGTRDMIVASRASGVNVVVVPKREVNQQ